MKNIPYYQQRGATLMVVLVLLLMATLLGLASMRGTLLEERMSSNLYDRGLAFQAAERGLREAEEAVRTGAVLGENCDPTEGGIICPIPDSSGTLNGVTWMNASAASAGDLAASRPQYVVQRLQSTSSFEQLGQGQNAGGTNEQGPGGNQVLQANYRIYARSHDPGLEEDRAVVMLQSNVVRR